MKKFCVTLLILIISACAPSKPGGDELPTSPAVLFPPTWTPTIEQPTRTPPPPTFTPTPTVKPLPIEGCNPRFISDSVVPLRIPSLSSDGQMYVYLCGSSEDTSICLMSKDGSNQHVIIDDIGNVTEPQWSPVEDIIAFVQREGPALQRTDPPSWDIYLISPSGENLFQVTDNPTMVHHTIEEIQWSPDGERIAFSTGGFSGSEATDIYVINNDGSGLHRLSYPPALNYSPRWSPDGRQLAYYSVSKEDITYLVIVDMDKVETPEIRIPLPIAGEFSWSPDGKSILYARAPDWHSNIDLHLYDLNSAVDYQLTPEESSEFYLIWTKDGSTIFFVSNMDESNDLYSMKLDESELLKQVDNLTDASIHNPLLSKDGNSIYFFLSGGRKDIYEMWAVDLIEECD
jgi:Tol biopolymer transport system component